MAADNLRQVKIYLKVIGLVEVFALFYLNYINVLHYFTFFDCFRFIADLMDVSENPVTLLLFSQLL